MLVKTDIQRDVVIDRIMGLRLDKKSYEITIKPVNHKRSVDQNSLYWLWLTIIEHETGNDKDTLHEYFKTKYLGTNDVKVFGITMTKAKSSTGLDTKQFTDYLNNIYQEITDYGIELPTQESKDLAECMAFYSNYL